VVLIQRFTRELAMFAGSAGRLSSQEGVSGCEMTHANELKRRDAPIARELTL
jgi:hypothetical protein